MAPRTWIGISSYIPQEDDDDQRVWGEKEGMHIQIHSIKTTHSMGIRMRLTSETIAVILALHSTSRALRVPSFFLLKPPWLLRMTMLNLIMKMR